VEKRDLWMFSYPPRKDLVRIGCRSVCLGSYIRWDTKKQVEIIQRELGWKGQQTEGVPPEYDYEKIECTFQGMRDYAKYVKRGYGRTNHLASIDVRNDRLTREEALKLESRYDGRRPASMDWFLRILDLTEEDFYAILEKHQVHPWKFDSAGVKPGEALSDMPKWDNTDVDKAVGPEKDSEGATRKYV